ncbi:unnamed protein product [Coffea canephora]|uniref:DH200=94 genomic scaffold, scaffold_109 n=1 Tax=Coffea canephora TaxID=49390 RepID=A0A068V5G2_COFCA|nr:unnamed protein product [Coffea canephora]
MGLCLTGFGRTGCLVARVILLSMIHLSPLITWQHVWQTSWAIIMRFVGDTIMIHGDGTGLMLPPRLAPVQMIFLILIWSDRFCISSITLKTLQVAGIKIKVDDSDQRTPGWKYNFWEMKVCPASVDFGPRDVSTGTVVISRRDIPRKEGKDFGISTDSSIFVAYVQGLLDGIRSCLLERATTFMSFFFLEF